MVLINNFDSLNAAACRKDINAALDKKPFGKFPYIYFIVND
jgi:hypothetical protein